MATTTIVKHTCDVCGDTADHLQIKLDVIFQTEQTEGRSVPNYLSIVTIDLCKECKKHLLKGNYIFATGAMGYNKYRFLGDFK